MQNVKQSLIASSYVILEKAGRILLIRRCNTGFADGQYSLVAGHVEPGESFQMCAIRESKEEFGIKIEQKDLGLFHIVHRYALPEPRIDVFFLCKKWKGEIVNMEPSKCDDSLWVESDKLPQKTLYYVEHAIKRGKQNIKFSEWK